MAKKSVRRPSAAASRRSAKTRSTRGAGSTKSRPKRSGTRRKARKNPPQFGWQLFKSALGLAVLVLLVVCAGALANHLLLRAPYGRLVAPAPPAVPPVGQAVPQKTAPKQSAAPAPARHKVPTYEVFNQDTPPETAPKPPSTSLTPDSRRPRVAILIDDLGYDLKLAERFLALEGTFTFSMLPEGPFTRKIIAKAHAQGHEIMLHLPMEPLEFPQVSPGPGALLARMTPDELLAQLDADLAAVPHVRGVNNHMGSHLSTLAPQMRQVFSRLKSRGLYYVDSRTTTETVGRPTAERLHLPFAERDIFIDHYPEADFIRKQLRRLVKRAQVQGTAIGIAHPHPLTVDLLAATLPELRKSVTLVPVSEVVQVAE